MRSQRFFAPECRWMASERIRTDCWVPITLVYDPAAPHRPTGVTQQPPAMPRSGPLKLNLLRFQSLYPLELSAGDRMDGPNRTFMLFVGAAVRRHRTGHSPLSSKIADHWLPIWRSREIVQRTYCQLNLGSSDLLPPREAAALLLQQAYPHQRAGLHPSPQKQHSLFLQQYY